MLPSLSCTMEFCLSLPGHLKVCSVSEAPAVQKLQGDSEGCVMLAKETYIIRSIVKSSEATSSFSSPPDNSLTDVLRPAVASDVAAPCKVRRIFQAALACHVMSIHKTHHDRIPSRYELCSRTPTKKLSRAGQGTHPYEGSSSPHGMLAVCSPP